MKIALTMSFEELKRHYPEVADTTLIEPQHPWYAQGFPEKVTFTCEMEAGWDGDRFIPNGTETWTAVALMNAKDAQAELDRHGPAAKRSYEWCKIGDGEWFENIEVG